jgi:hypothetical protein
MTKILSFALAAALCAPAFAQKMGSTNSNAPTIKQTIVAGDAKISLDYTSITWASGKTMGRLMDKESTDARARVNKMAGDQPLGSMTSSVDLMLGDLHIPAGDYKVYFTIDDDLTWSINFKGKEKTLTSKLALMPSDHESKRLLLCLYAGEEDGAGVYVSFGDKMGMLELKPAAQK